MRHHFDQRGQGVDEDDLARTIQRATRSVPGSGEVWARYIRHLVCVTRSTAQFMIDDGITGTKSGS